MLQLTWRSDDLAPQTAPQDEKDPLPRPREGPLTWSGSKRARTADLLHACESWACRYRAFRLGPARVGVWWRRVTPCIPDRLLACLANDLSPGLPAPAWPPSLA